MSHTYIEATKGIEVATLKIDVFLDIFHELRADAEDTTLRKQTKLCVSFKIQTKKFSDSLCFFSLLGCLILNQGLSISCNHCFEVSKKAALRAGRREVN